MSLNVRKTEAAEKAELAPRVLEICLARLELGVGDLKMQVGGGE